MTNTALALRILRMKVGEPFTTRQILGFGSRAVIDQTLSRLVREKRISRIARGVFVRPRVSRYGGGVSPLPEEIALAVAEGAPVTPHGAEAARRLGLTTQVPLHPIFLTSGQPRTVRHGRLTIQLRHRPPRQMVLAGRPAGLALSALLHLGSGQVTEEVVETIRQRIGDEEFQALREATQAIPAWLAKRLANAEL